MSLALRFRCYIIEKPRKKVSWESSSVSALALPNDAFVVRMSWSLRLNTHIIKTSSLRIHELISVFPILLQQQNKNQVAAHS